jgi:ABC-type siderophore export system fused ATPase/permease subunit
MRYFLATILLFAVSAVAVPRAEAAALTRQEAIVQVQRETGGKVLSAETKQVGRQIIYRIKVLTRDGKVKIVEVPADDHSNGTNTTGGHTR